ncbi:hypothetical protein N781_08290 [Pontibacillus halophilus JSM 076056 = DSM 19796]|uniref:Uncharacterized protein n=1 Tax=Pontibacillus halophilus JSM 076056 = DSM 19796 TaxID=1385510 RepID=A0A0A5GE09_9BACI|nr:hypothetical protein N781_08290 [Pontibacillus halophilus JSM 076056 = DSM 19796]
MWEYMTDMTFVFALVIGSIVAIVFLFIQKRKP